MLQDCYRLEHVVCFCWGTGPSALTNCWNKLEFRVNCRCAAFFAVKYFVIYGIVI